MMRPTPSTTALFALLSLTWGSEWMLAGNLRSASPFATSSFVCLSAGVLLLPFAWAARRAFLHRGPGFRAIREHLLIGTGLIALPMILAAVASSRIGFGDSAVINAAVPLLAASCRARTRGLQGLCLAGLAGVSFLVANALRVSWRIVPILVTVIALAIVTTAALLFAKTAWHRADPVGSAPSDTRPTASATVSVAASVCIQLLWAAAVLALAHLVVEHRVISWPRGSLWAFALSVAFTGGGYLLFFHLLRVLPAAKLAAYAWGQILVTVCEAAWLFGQRLDWQMLLGAAVILGSLVLLLRAPDHSGPCADPESDTLMLRITERT